MTVDLTEQAILKLAPAHNYPRTWPELLRFARAVIAADRALDGHLIGDAKSSSTAVRSGRIDEAISLLLGAATFYSCNGYPTIAENCASTAQALRAERAVSPDRAPISLAIDALERLNERPRPMCRDCADNDGMCPNSGLPCDMQKCISDARKALASLPGVSSDRAQEVTAFAMMQNWSNDRKQGYIDGALTSLPSPAEPQEANRADEDDCYCGPGDACPTPARCGRAAPSATTAAPVQHVGDSSFEAWFASYTPQGGDKQRARDAYAAGMSDPLGAPVQPIAQVKISRTPGNTSVNWEWASDRAALESLPDGRHDLYAAPFYAAPMQAEPVAEVESWTNGSYSRNYKLRWLKDVPEGTKLYAAPPHPAEPASREEWLAQTTATLERLDAKAEARRERLGLPPHPAEARDAGRDTERLDWLATHGTTIIEHIGGMFTVECDQAMPDSGQPTLRAALDAARAGAKGDGHVHD